MVHPFMKVALHLHSNISRFELGALASALHFELPHEVNDFWKTLMISNLDRNLNFLCIAILRDPNARFKLQLFRGISHPRPLWKQICGAIERR